MSPKTKKYLITTRKQEILRIQPTATFFNFCLECEKQVEMLTLDVITFQTGKSTRELFRLIESHSLHSTETERGHLLVCLNSLEAIYQQNVIKTEGGK